MTKEELKIYRKVQFEFWVEDAEWHTKDYLENSDLDISLDKFDFGAMAQQFEDAHDCNVAENSTWDRIIEEWISDIAWEENEPYCQNSTARDYSPSNPWDAPGMSVRDFI